MATAILVTLVYVALGLYSAAGEEYILKHFTLKHETPGYRFSLRRYLVSAALWPRDFVRDCRLFH